MRRVQRTDYDDQGVDGDKEFEYDKTKQSLQVQDLQRYSVQTLLIDSYQEITSILEELEAKYHQRTVFVSGSAQEFQEPFNADRMRTLCELIGRELIERGLNLVS